jgi:hypothetical protein
MMMMAAVLSTMMAVTRPLLSIFYNFDSVVSFSLS